MSSTILTDRRGGNPYQQALASRRSTTRRRAAISDPERHAAYVRRSLLIGSRIRQARERLGLSQSRLALQVDTSRSTLSVWECVKSAPGPLTLERLAEALGEPLHYFYGGPTAHPLPIRQDPDPYAQPTQPPQSFATTGPKAPSMR